MARSQFDVRTFVANLGSLLGISHAGNLLQNGKPLSMPCVDAIVTVDPTATSPRAITIQLLDSEGRDIDYVETVEIIAFGDAGKLSFSAGGSTGLAIGTDGALLATVAKQHFIATSEADGDIDLTHTDSGTVALFVGVRLPNGRIVMGDRAATIGT